MTAYREEARRKEAISRRNRIAELEAKNEQLQRALDYLEAELGLFKATLEVARKENAALRMRDTMIVRRRVL